MAKRVSCRHKRRVPDSRQLWGGASDTQARFFTGRYQRRSIPVIGHNVPQEAPAVTAAAILELLKA